MVGQAIIYKSNIGKETVTMAKKKKRDLSPDKSQKTKI
jgi:hypothetical protein